MSKLIKKEKRPVPKERLGTSCSCPGSDLNSAGETGSRPVDWGLWAHCGCQAPRGGVLQQPQTHP